MFFGFASAEIFKQHYAGMALLIDAFSASIIFFETPYYEIIIYKYFSSNNMGNSP